MSATKRWAMECEEHFWDLAESKIGECETLREFIFRMSMHTYLIPYYMPREIDDMLGEAWHEFWSSKGEGQ